MCVSALDSLTTCNWSSSCQDVKMRQHKVFIDSANLTNIPSIILLQLGIHSIVCNHNCVNALVKTLDCGEMCLHTVPGALYIVQYIM